MMDEILLRLQELSRKVVKLEKSLRQAEEAKHALADRVSTLEAALQAKEEVHQGFMQKYEALKLSKSIASPEDRTAIQQKIDLYLEEIDLCLKSLGD